VLLYREETSALRAVLEQEVLDAVPGDIAGLAARHLRRDLGSAILQAAAALPGRGGISGEPRRRAAVATACALDPTLFDRLPAGLRAVEGLRPPVGPSALDRLDVLPGGAELADWVTREPAAGQLLGAVFPARVARALVARLAIGPLTAGQNELLGSVIDPFTLSRAASAVAVREGDLAGELYPLWRSDLPMPVEVASGLRGGVAARLAMARELARHRGSDAQDVLAELLLDGDLEVRTVAGVTLFRLWADRIPFDPRWDLSRRRIAAEQLRSLHNRRP